MWRAAVVDHDNSFLIIGGVYDDGTLNAYGGPWKYSDKIYKYEVEGGEWLELPTTLSEGKSIFTAMKIKPSLIGTC